MTQQMITPVSSICENIRFSFACSDRSIFCISECHSASPRLSIAPRHPVCLRWANKRLWRCCVPFVWLRTLIQLLLHLFTCAELTTTVPGVGGGPRHAGRATVTRIRASTPTVTRQMDTVTARWAANTHSCCHWTLLKLLTSYCCRFYLIVHDIIHVKTLELFQLLIAVAVYMHAATWQLMLNRWFTVYCG